MRADPHVLAEQAEPEPEGPTAPEQEPVEKGRPPERVKEQAEKVEREGRPADEVGEIVTGAPEDEALAESQEERAHGAPVDEAVREGGPKGVPHDEVVGKAKKKKRGRKPGGQDAE